MRSTNHKPFHLEADDGNGCPGPGAGSEASKTTPKVQEKGTSISKSGSMEAQPKCLYKNAWSIRN